MNEQPSNPTSPSERWSLAAELEFLGAMRAKRSAAEWRAYAGRYLAGYVQRRVLWDGRRPTAEIRDQILAELMA
jgi:hypothetical protein